MIRSNLLNKGAIALVTALYLTSCSHMNSENNIWSDTSKKPAEVKQLSYSCSGSIANYHYTVRSFADGTIEADQFLYFRDGGKRLARQRSRQFWHGTSLWDEMRVFQDSTNKLPLPFVTRIKLKEGDLDKIRNLKPGESGSYRYVRNVVKEDVENLERVIKVNHKVLKAQTVNRPFIKKQRAIVIEETREWEDPKGKVQAVDKITRTFIPGLGINNSWVHRKFNDGKQIWLEECKLNSFASHKFQGAN